MNYNARRLISNATKNISNDALSLQKINEQRYNMRERPKPIFQKNQEIKNEQELLKFKAVIPVELPSYPSDIQWKNLERRAMARRENCCMICLDVIGYETVILCSCGHFFHMSCLKAAQMAEKCPVCKRQVFFKESSNLENYSVRLCVIKIETHSRQYLAKKYANARRVLIDGTFTSKIIDVEVASDRLSNEAQLTMDVEYYEAKQIADESSRLYEEMVKIRSVDSWSVLQKARKLKNYICPVCLDEIPIKFLSLGDECSDHYATSCCGSVFHGECILESERAGIDVCPYCRGGYYKVAVNVDEL